MSMVSRHDPPILIEACMNGVELYMRPLGNGCILRHQHLDHDVRVAGLDDPVTPDIEDLHDLDRDAAIAKADELRPYAEFKFLPLVAIGIAVRGLDWCSGDDSLSVFYGAGKDVHPWGAYKMTYERMTWLFKKLDGRADLHDLAV